MSLKETLTENNSRLETVKMKVAELTRSEEKTVTLDLEDGDQVVIPTGHINLSKVTITKPDTLLPENILDGITIAGVEGKAFQVKTGTFSVHIANFYSEAPFSVTSLGFKPKYLFIRPSGVSESFTGAYVYFNRGEAITSEEGLVVYSWHRVGNYLHRSDTTTGSGWKYPLTIDDDGFTIGIERISGVANPTSSDKVQLSGTFDYIAIG